MQQSPSTILHVPIKDIFFLKLILCITEMVLIAPFLNN